jgi:hypothetical protein
MTTAVQRVVYGVRGALEATYGSGASLTDDNYIHLTQDPHVTIEPLNDGSMGVDPRSGAQAKRVRQSGRHASVLFSTYVRGSTDLATVPPRDIDVLLQSAGHERIQTTISSQPAWLYQPMVDDFTSAAFDIFSAKKQFRLEGAFGHELLIEASNLGVLRFSTAVTGILRTITDAAIPTAPTHDLVTSPVLFDGRGLSVSPVIGNWNQNCKVRSLKLKSAQEKVSRPSGTDTDGTAGIAIGRRVSQLEVVAEQVPLSVFNPYTLRDAQTPVVMSFVCFGEGHYWYLVSDAAQLEAVVDEEDGSTAMWRMTFSLNGQGRARVPYRMVLAQTQ